MSSVVTRLEHAINEIVTATVELAHIDNTTDQERRARIRHNEARTALTEVLRKISDEYDELALAVATPPPFPNRNKPPTVLDFRSGSTKSYDPIWTKTDYTNDFDSGPVCDRCEKDAVQAYFRDTASNLEEPEVYCEACAPVVWMTQDVEIVEPD